jgi:hypothetical protein
MPILANYEAVGDLTDQDDLIMSDAGNILVKKETLDAGSVVRGEVLGKITSGGKVIASVGGGSGGSEVPYGIAAHDADASDGDVQVLVYIRGNFNELRITMGGTHTADSIREGLRGKGIFLEKPVPRYPA